MDQIRNIFGRKMPFLPKNLGLKLDACDGTYTPKGQCYIHGMMDGEILDSEIFNETKIRLK
jgi:hypothetical protein